MVEPRKRLVDALVSYYESCDWSPTRHEDGTVRARGIGGVTWIGLPVVGEDLADPAFAESLKRLCDERMPSGELCPIELLPDTDCADELRSLLDELLLSDRGHVEVYSLTT